jgi:uncharacterized membrane protein YdjX (TVP38/TMEM64 family)
MRWVLLLLLVAAIAGFYLSGLHEAVTLKSIHANLDDWQNFAGENLLVALLIYLLVYAVVTGLSLPIAVLISLVGGAIFGRWLGTAVVSLASTLGATLAFLASRYLFRDTIQRRFGQRLEVLNKGVEQDGAYYLFSLRLVPAVPFFLINVGMGLTPIRVWIYVLVSWIGMLPGTFVYVNIGTGLATLDSLAGLVSFEVLGPLALLGLFPLVIRKLLQWWNRSRCVTPSSRSD